jgi:hypothetical protein
VLIPGDCGAADWPRLGGLARWNGDRPRLDEGDREGWQQLTRRLGKRLNLIGYDFFTTNVTRLERGVALRAANGVLVKGEPKRNP